MSHNPMPDELAILIADKVRQLSIQKKEAVAQHAAQHSEQRKLVSQLRSTAGNVKHSLPIQCQTTGGIGGHWHKHGIPGGRYSARGATSARGRHHKRSK